MAREISMDSISPSYIGRDESSTKVPRTFSSVDAAKEWLKQEKGLAEIDPAKQESDVVVFVGKKEQKKISYEEQHSALYWNERPMVTLERSKSGNHVSLDFRREFSRIMQDSDRHGLFPEELMQERKGPEIMVPLCEDLAVIERKTLLEKEDLNSYDLNTLADNATTEELLQIAKHPHLGRPDPYNPFVDGRRTFIEKVPKNATSIRKAFLERSDLSQSCIFELVKGATYEELLQIARHPNFGQSYIHIKNFIKIINAREEDTATLWNILSQQSDTNPHIRRYFTEKMR